MTTERQESASENPEPAPSSVAHGVLETFFEALEETEGYGEVAQRLRETVLAKKSFSDGAIKAAIFGDNTP